MSEIQTRDALLKIDPWDNGVRLQVWEVPDSTDPYRRELAASALLTREGILELITGLLKVGQITPVIEFEWDEETEDSEDGTP
jgi:hypothetical protein